MIEDKLHDLPEGWMWSELDQISEIVLGQSPPSATYNTEKHGLPFFQGKREFGDLYPTVNRWCSEPRKIAEKGDILISVRAPVGPTNICPARSCIGRGLAAIRSSRFFNALLLLYYFRIFEEEIAQKGTGSTFAAITGKQLRSLLIPVPPIPEQHRIVNKIEELFTNLDAGIETLKKVQAQVKRYRQAVLKHAFEGKLTAAWREENKKNFEHATLIEQFWGKYDDEDEKVHMDLLGISGLQKKWGVLRLEHIVRESRIGLVRSLKEQSDNAEYGYGYIKMNNVTMDGKILLNEVVYVKATKKELELYSLKNNDILFNTRNSHELVGKAGIVKGLQKKNMIFNNNLMRIRTISSISPQFLLYQMCSPRFRHEMEMAKRSTTNVSALYAKDIMPLPIIICTFEEQQKIVEEIELRFSIADRVEEIVEQNLKRVERLRQSILKKAFEGKLVPQDPTDEPASVLLERIRTEKEKSDNRNNRRKRSRN